jgi:hypothetical protein
MYRISYLYRYFYNFCLIEQASEPHGNTIAWTTENTAPGARQPILQAGYGNTLKGQ